jgi:hypothetical protein
MFLEFDASYPTRPNSPWTEVARSRETDFIHSGGS